MTAGEVPWALHPETLAIGLGYDPETGFRAVKPPLVMSSTFGFPSAQAAKEAHQAFFDGHAPARGAGYIYARLDHPNLGMVQARMAALDGAEDAAVFSSGMAAVVATLLATLRPGDSLLHSRPLYGGTQALLDGPLAGLGIRAFGFADALAAGSMAEAAATARGHGPVGLIHVETPANPTAGLADIGLAAKLADTIGLQQDRRPVVVVDNTFLGPLQQAPLALGADVCLTSLTKYVGGHSDLLAGCISGSALRVGPIRRLRALLGTHLDPHSCWLLLRSVETFALRSGRAADNAAKVARFLADHPKVASVTYLGFLEAGSPAQAAYTRQCSGAGSTFAFRIKGGEREAFALLDLLRVARLAVSLGGTETLICHPASTTHYPVARELRQAMGVDDATLRISVGIEHPDDLITDLKRALDAF